MSEIEFLTTVWRLAPFAFAAWLIGRGRARRDRGDLPSRLYLRDKGRQVQGLCKGISEYFGVSVLYVRAIALVVVATNVYGLLVYLVTSVAFEWHPEDKRDWLRTRLRRSFARRAT